MIQSSKKISKKHVIKVHDISVLVKKVKLLEIKNFCDYLKAKDLTELIFQEWMRVKDKYRKK